MLVSSVVSEYKNHIDQALSELLEKLTDNSSYSETYGRASLRLIDALRYSVEDAGKRIRPTLALLAAEAVLGSKIGTKTQR